MSTAYLVMLKRAQSDLELLETMIASMDESVPFSTVNDLIREARDMIATLQKESGM